MTIIATPKNREFVVIAKHNITGEEVAHHIHHISASRAVTWMERELWHTRKDHTQYSITAMPREAYTLVTNVITNQTTAHRNTERELKKSKRFYEAKAKRLIDQMWGEYLKRGENVTPEYYRKQQKCNELKQIIADLTNQINQLEAITQ